MNTLTLYTLCIIALILQSCGDSTAPTSDANQTVNIGSQVWMKKNLDMSTYRNGDPIRYASTPAEWQDAKDKQEGAWCYYNNDPKKGEIYGKLYNWYAVNDKRGLAPAGYHIPSDEEWLILIEYLGKYAIYKMKSTNGWDNGGNGDNSSGFNGLPGGSCKDDGSFYGVGENGFWWSSTESNVDRAWRIWMPYGYSEALRAYSHKFTGISVRCLRD